MRLKYIIPILSFVLFSCGEEEKPRVQEFEWTKTQSSDLNKGIAENEEIDIDYYLEMRPAWKMTKTGSGLRYWVYEQGEGEETQAGDVARIQYVIELLDGDECYRTEDGESEDIVVDRSDIETGVQEALKLMKVGDKAKIIVPSHLGHGLLGDLNKIPPLHALVIDLKLIGLKK